MTRTLTQEAVRPQLKLPRRLAAMMRPELPSLSREIIQEVRRSIPEYGRPMEGPYVETLRIGVERALTDFVEQVANPRAPRERYRETYRRLGRFEAQEGRTLDTLQAAFRIGAQVAWRRIMKVGPRRHLSSDVMAQLADALFTYIDELAALALQGYLEERPDGEIKGHRRRLLELLLRPRGPRSVLDEVAARARWPIPDEMTVVAAPPGSPYVRGVLEDDVLADLNAPEPFLVMPGRLTPERRRVLLRVLPEGQLVAGPRAAAAGLADSLRWARHALRLVETGILPGAPVTDCDDHLITLLLLSDQALVDRLAHRHLSELSEFPSRQRGRLMDTLHAWLVSRGTAAEIAEELNIHPQTVRYRMRQLEGVLGDRLNDPEARFAIEVVLRATSLRQQSAEDAGDTRKRLTR